GVPPALRLAGRGARYLGHDVDPGRHLERGQPLAAVVDQIPGLRVPVQGHRGRDQLPVLVVRDPEADRITYRWMGHQRLLDLGRRDVLAAPYDHLLDPPGQGPVAALQHPAVAVAELAAGERLGVGRGAVRVTGHLAGHAD